MAVLVAASPCALAIATPSAVLSGVARAARGGVLIKGGAPLEAMGHLDAIAFDKTGTLTIGEPHLVEITPYGDATETELLQVSAAVEMLSDHPLAQAVVRDVKDRLGDLPSEASDFANIIGQGVSAKVDSKVVHIGKTALFESVAGLPLPDDLRGTVEAMSQNGRTTMIVRSGDRYLGAIGLMDTPREDARSVIAALRDLGLKRMMMISGDNQNVANAVAKEVGLDTAFGDLMPEDKVTKIAALKADGGVAMVGDGVNDAPAMANATVGIAMGAAGSDVALETADIALMADDLQTLPFAVGLSHPPEPVVQSWRCCTAHSGDVVWFGDRTGCFGPRRINTGCCCQCLEIAGFQGQSRQIGIACAVTSVPCWVSLTEYSSGGTFPSSQFCVTGRSNPF